MRLGFVLSCLEPYGGHIAVLEIAERVAGRGHDVAIVHPARSILSRRNALLRRQRWLPAALAPALYRHERRQLDWFDFSGEVIVVPELEDRHLPELDAVVATAWQTAEWVGGFGARTGRQLYFIQGLETWSGPAERVEATWRMPFIRVATSAWLQRVGRDRFGLDDIQVVPQGVDTTRFFPDPPPAADTTRPRVGFLYHPARHKGVRDILEALARLGAERRIQPVAFGIFPRGTELPRELEYHDCPSRDALRRIYSSLDVFVCASWSETGPLTVPEALACETCVVSTDVGNVSLWTGGGRGAFLVAPQRPGLLAQALACALDDPTERERRAAHGRQLIAAFTWDRAAEAFERIVEQALEAPRAGTSRRRAAAVRL